MKKCIKMMSVILAVVMVLTAANIPAVVNASIINPDEKLVWDKAYSGEVQGKPVGGQRDIYEYAITLPKSGKVNFTVNISDCASGGAVTFEIQNSAGEYIDSYNRTDGTSPFSIDLQAGDYKLQVYCANLDWNHGKFSFKASYTQSKESYEETIFINNNSIGLETPYTLGNTMNGFLAVNDKSDMYSFTVPKNGYLKMELYTEEITEYNFELVESEGKVKYTNGDETLKLGKTVRAFFVPAGTYYFTIKTIDFNDYLKKYSGNYNFKLTRSDMPVAKVKSAKNNIKKGLTIKVSGDANITGFQVQVSTSKDFKKNKKQKTFEKNQKSVKLKKLKKGKKYYVRVRTYVQNANDGVKYYSDWSGAKTVKVKK